MFLLKPLFSSGIFQPAMFDYQRVAAFGFIQDFRGVLYLVFLVLLCADQYFWRDFPCHHCAIPNKRHFFCFCRGVLSCFKTKLGKKLEHVVSDFFQARIRMNCCNMFHWLLCVFLGWFLSIICRHILAGALYFTTCSSLVYASLDLFKSNLWRVTWHSRETRRIWT